MKVDFCPCGRKKQYADCCGKVHQNIVNAITAEDLMRSRYTAFVKADGDYLVKSHHALTRDKIEKDKLVGWAKSVKWLRLEILNTTGGGEADVDGTVEFKAHYRDRSGKRMIHEKSKFVREYGCWSYLEAMK